MTEISAEETANEVSKPGKFSLIDRLQNRNYPTEKVSIYLAEDAAYERQVLKEEAADIRVIGTDEEKEEAEARLEAIFARIDELSEIIKGSEAVVTMRAISSDRYDELLAQARARFPVKYEKVLNPLTGRAAKEEIESPDRDALFTNLFISDTIVQVTSGDEVDDEITPEWFRDFQRFAPLDAIRVIVSKSYKMRMMTEWMDEVQNEDFSPRP